ncbi:MAG TPA: hypothetical protein VFU62_13365 [Hanamia sp.]|nr:hypothetical protein [Hanamia sp.]
MRKSLFFIFIISFVMSVFASAQKRKIQFQSINQFAIVGGESHINIAFQTINGIKFSNWSSGIGIGIDYYRYKTLPLFFDGRWNFGEDKRAFVYGDIGYNFPMKNKPGKEISYYSSYHFTGGIYSDLGIGFEIPLMRKSSLLFSLGYSSKELKTKVGSAYQCIVAPCPVDYNVYEFSFNRMILKAGLGF